MALGRRIGLYLVSQQRAGIVACFGAVLFLVQSLWYAHTSISSLDEGAYLYKGILFATGQYRPFQPYGVWTNKAPFAFLIPGYFEMLFGPGLRTGRYLSIFMGLLVLLAVWIAALRVSRDRWLAAASVWAFALAPGQIKIYSQGLTQSTIASMLAWMLVLALGKGRPLWQLILSGFLAGMMSLTRQNMIFVMPILFAYIFWENGWKAGLYSFLAGLGILLFIHVLYWPYIMQLWLPWLPTGLRAFFLDAAITDLGKAVWNPSVSWDGRLLSFFEGFRDQFVAMAGSLVTFLLWPKRHDWKTTSDFRAAVFLGALFIILLFAHLWSAILLGYCVYCFSGYIAFFYVAAILLVVLVLSVWRKSAGIIRQALLGFAMLIVSVGIGFSAFSDLGDTLLGLYVPRVAGGRLLPGFTTLWETISNKFLVERNMAEKIVSALGGLSAGIFLLLLALLIYKMSRGRQTTYAYVLAVTVLTFGFVLSPILAGSGARADCSTDVIEANEQVGAYLRQNIPQGSSVYWNGGLSVAPLLYLPGIKIFPAQINGGYAFRVDGDPQQLLKYGLWNAQLRTQWLAEADFVIVEAGRYGNMMSILVPERFDQLSASPVPTSCVDGSRLLVFKRK